MPERDETPIDSPSSFLGTGWSFPPEFPRDAGGTTGAVAMRDAEEDVQESLHILFGTARGERVLNPNYGLDLHEFQFGSVGTTMRTLLEDRIRLAILVHEPRIDLLSVEVTTPGEEDGTLHVELDYVVRATNTRFNLVYPFYQRDANELSSGIAVP
jgi:phage baseplate assembly protein W